MTHRSAATRRSAVTHRSVTHRAPRAPSYGLVAPRRGARRRRRRARRSRRPRSEQRARRRRRRRGALARGQVRVVQRGRPAVHLDDPRLALCQVQSVPEGEAANPGTSPRAPTSGATSLTPREGSGRRARESRAFTSRVSTRADSRRLARDWARTSWARRGPARATPTGFAPSKRSTAASWAGGSTEVRMRTVTTVRVTAARMLSRKKILPSTSCTTRGSTRRARR